jgi:exonuclease SbcC
MTWLRKIVKKAEQIPAPKTTASRAAAGAPRPSAAEIERLRQAVAAAAPGEERARAELQLGKALALARWAPEAHDSPGVVIAAVCEVQDKTVALAWLERVAGDESFAALATRARFAEVRLAAARRIADSAFLQRVAEATRERDKGVYRHCSDVLKERRQKVDREHRAAETAEALRALLETVPLPVSRLVELEKAVQGLGDAGEIPGGCTALLARARDRAREEAQALRELQAQGAAANALKAEATRDHWPVSEKLPAWNAKAAELRTALGSLPQWLGRHAAGQALERALRDVEARLAQLADDLQRHEACERFLAEAAVADAAAQGQLAAGWSSLAKPASQAARRALEARWAEISAQWAPPPEPPKAEEPKPAPRPRVDVEAARSLLEQFEQRLEEGHLHDAEAASKRLDTLLGQARVPGSLEGRLRRAHAQLARLRGWARWGTDQAREHLVEAAETLLREPPSDVEDLAYAIKSLRGEWKHLDSHGPGSRSQWERFDGALEKAYRPVAERRVQEAARHAEAKAAKEALLAEWEAWLAGIAWDHADWKVIEAAREDMFRRWRAAPTAGFKDERQLRKRYDVLVAQLDTRRKAVHDAEIARRDRLIAAAEGLKDEPDIGRAVSEAKALQARWRDEAGSLRLRRSEEEKAWKKFRAALDVVFARRDAARAEKDAQRAQQQAQRAALAEGRRGLLQELEAALGAGEPGAVEQAVTRFREAWSAAEAAPRDLAAELEARARELQQRARQRIEELRRERRLARYAVLAQKSALVERIEIAAAAGEPAEKIVSEVTAELERLPRLSAEAERCIAGRLAAAASVTGAALAAGEGVRDQLLLDLEIALGLPTPAAHQDARRARQLGKLQEHFGHGSSATPQPEQMYIRYYATAAVTRAEQEQRMGPVMRKLMEQEGR